jgi:eukaryotic-like serine/threonine-protein kinase
MSDLHARDTALGATVVGVPQAGAATTKRPGTTSAFVRSTVLPPARQVPTPAAERFAPLEPLGMGGMGEVVLVDDRDIERKVAIKRLRADRASEPALQRFAEEVRIIGQLEHPNITPVHDVGVDEGGQHYFVMKYVQGETLESVIDKLRAGDEATVRRFGYDERVELFLAVLNAIAYAHANGVIHRDIKPSNIMVGPYGEVTLMDWGLARRKETPETTPAGALQGTPLYMSPEQARGDHARVDERSDIFSLCLVFYELMTLHHPLADKQSVAEIIAQLTSEGLDAKRAKKAFLDSGAPCEYGYALEYGLQFDPGHRYGSVRELIEAVQRARAGRFAVQCHITFSKRVFEETARFIDRHPRVYSVIFAGVIAGAGYGLWRLAAHLLG